MPNEDREFKLVRAPNGKLRLLQLQNDTFMELTRKDFTDIWNDYTAIHLDHTRREPTADAVSIPNDNTAIQSPWKTVNPCAEIDMPGYKFVNKVPSDPAHEKTSEDNKGTVSIAHHILKP